MTELDSIRNKFRLIHSLTGEVLNELEKIRPDNKPVKRDRRKEGIEKHLQHLNKY